MLFVKDLCIIVLFDNLKLFVSIVLLVKSGGFVDKDVDDARLVSLSLALNEVNGASIDGKISSLASFSKSTSNEPIFFLLPAEIFVSVDFEFVLFFVNESETLRMLFSGEMHSEEEALISLAVKLVLTGELVSKSTRVFFDEATDEDDDSESFFFSFEL